MSLTQAQRNYDAMTPPEDYVYSDDVEFSIKQMQDLYGYSREKAIAELKRENEENGFNYEP